MSAGIGIFPASYPVSLMAEETASLEEQAKANEGKDSVALFGNEYIRTANKVGCSHIYKWTEFEEEVIGRKLRLLQSYCNSREDVGAALLYRFMEYIRGAADERINLARFVYQLGRLQPGEKAGEEAEIKYSNFCRNMYAWFTDENDRKQLLTAINIMVYLNRDKENQGG